MAATPAAVQGRRLLTLLVIAIAVAVVCQGAVRWLPFAAVIENWVADLRVALLAPPAPDQGSVVVLAVTERTLDRFPYRSPIDRAFLAQVLEALAAKEVAAVGIDILFDRPSEADKDAALKAAMAAFPAPLVVADAAPGSPVRPVQAPFMKEFLDGVRRADANILRDNRDGTVRYIYPGAVAGGERRPAFAAALAGLAGAAPAEGTIPYAFTGPRADGGPAVPVYPAELAKQLAVPWLKGRIVLIGADVSDSDRFRTPFAALLGNVEGAMPGVLLHARAVEQLVSGRRLAELPAAAGFALTLGLAVAGVALILLNIPAAAKAAGLIAVGAALWVGAFALYAAGGPLLPVIAPSLSLAAAAGLGITYVEREERKLKRFIRDAFSRFVSPGVVERLLADPSRLRLGGERREMTFVFTDIAGFTTLSEKTDPEILVPTLNAYLDGMCEIVLAHDGTIDKFIGDAVVAIFGALEESADHAARAVACALAMDEFATAFAAARRAEGIDFGITRIGVHTGHASVGNFGGSRRFDYTAIGDVVNTAARLESVNKQLGGRVCVSGATAAHCPDILFRPAGTLVLKGKSEGIPALEPRPAAEAEGVAAYRRAFALLQSGEAGAREAFAALVAADPSDGLAAYQLARIERGESGDRIVLTDK